MNSFVATCKCGAAYGPTAWACLPYVGAQPGPEAGSAPTALRNCVCGSTISGPLEQRADRAELLREVRDAEAREDWERVYELLRAIDQDARRELREERGP